MKSKFVSFFSRRPFVLITVIYRKHPLYLSPHLIYLIFSESSRLYIPGCPARPFPLPLLASVISAAPDQRFDGPTLRSHLYHHNAQYATHLHRIRPFPPFPPFALPATSSSLPQTIHGTLPQRNVDAHPPNSHALFKDGL